MDIDMVDIQMDIQNGYPCWISMSFMDIQHGYPNLDMYGCGYGGYPKGYPKYISIWDIHVYYGYPTWISCLDIHNIHDIQRTYLIERVDEDYVSYPEVKYFHDELNDCDQSLMVALNDLDTSQRRVEQLESSIQGSLRYF